MGKDRGVGGASKLHGAGQHSCPGRLGVAMEEFERALAVQQEVLGSDSLSVAKTLRNIGIIAREQRAWDRSASAFAQAISIYEKKAGPWSATLANVLASYAGTLHEAGREDDARKMRQRAKAISDTLTRGTQ